MAIKKTFRLGEVENAFTIFQTDVGTSPTADSSTDTITFTSSDASVTITGNSTTDTINFQAAAGSALTVKSNGSTIDITVTTLDFSNQFTLSESPEDEINISLNFTNISHTSLQDIGTNTHTQIDTHIANTDIHFSESLAIAYAVAL